MPNHCLNSLVLSHENPEMLARAKTAIQEGRLCEEFVPLEEGTELPYGAIPCWGTKWDIFDVCMGTIEYPEGTFGVTFSTAWTPPIPVYQALEEAGFEVDARYFEPGMSFYGYYHKESDLMVPYSSPDEIDDDIMKEFNAWDMFESEEV